ncbi:hypothetical protein LWI29_023883 [Acer saccharum]|uniref:Uncharacterized protein n=1 Tax=Acer saccharum TaxID=4024 RepID=A0AA39SZT3_ACESA|nr:hypothetical protein LWI29_023883 [Acer saccharum]
MTHRGDLEDDDGVLTLKTTTMRLTDDVWAVGNFNKPKFNVPSRCRRLQAAIPSRRCRLQASIPSRCHQLQVYIPSRRRRLQGEGRLRERRRRSFKIEGEMEKIV